jgi:hypothetical protein
MMVICPWLGFFLNMFYSPPYCGENEKISHVHYTLKTAIYQDILSIAAHYWLN